MMILKLPRGAKLALIIAAVLWFTHRPLTEIAIDWMWFDAAGYLGIFKTSITARAALFGVGALLSAIFIGLNIRFAFKAQPIQADAFRLVSGEVLVDPARMAGLLKVVGWLATLLPALVFGMVASSLWLDVLSFVDRVPFGIEDAVFGHDVSFYVFELPMIAYARSIGVGTVVVTIIATGVYYLFHQSTMGTGPEPLSKVARKHLFALGGLLFVFAAMGWWLDRYDLLFQREGAVWGVGYTDEHARIPAFSIMMVAALGTSVAMFASVRNGNLKIPVTALGAYLSPECSLLVLGLMWSNSTALRRTNSVRRACTSTEILRRLAQPLHSIASK
jgi:uncharacterized membrane protein (UPF0182 family)